MEAQDQNELNEKKQAAYSIGVVVFIILIALTIGEYFVGSIAVGWTWPLWLIAIIKAAFIIRDYMHVNRLFSGDEESH
jgi:hypothetical protein